jgi:hypothetical protein
MPGITEKPQKVLRQAESWPEAVQDELADVVIEIAAGLEGEYRPTEEELAGIDRGLDAVRQGRFASDDAVKVAFGKFRRDEGSLHRCCD